jgi:hypothetical protein
MFERGCECGDVRFRLASAPIFVICCHCRQCQKLSGSAFALNGMIEGDRVELVDMETASVLQTDRGETRCRRCNTKLWATHRDFGDRILFVRLGTLDEADCLKPDAHFFVRSKHPWISVTDDTPVFEALPDDGDPPLLDEHAAARLAAAVG